MSFIGECGGGGRFGAVLWQLGGARVGKASMLSHPGVNMQAAQRMLNRFYGGFGFFCLLLLGFGVPFVFGRKLAAVCILAFNLLSLLAAWQMSRGGKPRQSLIFFSVLMWVEMVAVLYGGLAPNGAGLVFAFGLMLSVIVSQRAGLTFGISYLLAWLGYIVLSQQGLAPAPFFLNAPLTGWVIVVMAAWLILVPVPQLVKAMRQGSVQQRSVFEATSDALLVVGCGGRVESYNRKFIDMWHIPEHLAANQDDAALQQFVLAQLCEPQAFLDRVAQINAQEDLVSIDTIAFKDGRVIERHSHPNSVEGRIVGRVWSFRDVTESRRAQDALRSSQSKLQGLFELSPLGMARNDMAGKFHEANAAFCRMLGYSLDELRALSYWQITPHGYSAQEAAQLEKLRAQGVYGPYEKEYLHRDGHEIAVRLNGMLIHDADGQPFIWSIIEDISAQKAHEQMLTEARRNAEEASRAKSDFLANMSHEIRTPMNAILGMLQLLGNTALSANQFDYLSKSQGAAKSLLGLLNDILDLSKIDAGKMGLELLPFQLDRLLRDLAVVLSANVGPKKLEVLFDVDPQVPLQLVGDAMRLQQVLLNLGGNAIKFTGVGHVIISVRLAEARVPGKPGEVRLAFAVQDTGIGIAAANQQRIFSGFSQAESSTTRRFGGTGLGLAISQKLVEMMGGHISLRSELGVGSTFSFELALPLADAAPATAAAPAASVPASALVIDDEPVTGAIIAKMLRQHVTHVDVADSGAHGLELVRARAASGLTPYEAVYVDWQMPEMDGWETIRQLLALCRELAAPVPRVAMLSANSRQYLAQRTQQEQDLLSAFIVKPATASMLLEALQHNPRDVDTVRKLPRSSQRRLEGMRILVVEDNAINQQVAEELLGFEGALVSIAADGEQGVKAVATARPQFDAVLMDVQMPIMDGYAATRAIRQELGLEVLPIIGLTANAMATDRQACLQAGMNEHIGKPFQLPHLVSLLIRLTGRAPLAGEAAQPGKPAPPSGPELTAQADGVADINLAPALVRLDGMQGLYVKIARQFQDCMHTFIADLSRHLQAGQWQQAQILVHTLKGNAATLGLERLAQGLKGLEQQCKAQADAAAVLSQAELLESVIRAAHKALQQAIQQLQAPAGPS